MSIQRRGKSGTFILYRRIPARYAPLGLGKFYKKSLKTEDRDVAQEKADQIWRLKVGEWDALLAGEADRADEYHQRVVKVADRLGHPYLSASEISQEPLSAVLRRVHSVDSSSEVQADALLGGSSAPPLALTSLAEAYEEVMRPDNIQKSEAQMTRWRNGIARTVDAFIEAVGNKAVLDLTAADAFAYKTKLSDRLAAGEIAAYTVNREMYTLNAALKRTIKNRFGKDVDLFSGLLVKDKKSKRRNRQVSFSPDWITGKLLDRSLYGRTNEEAVDVFLCMVNTPARPSELLALRAATIRLDHPVPHISVEPDGRETKTVAAERQIPLVGLSLEILRKYPDGFPRYQGRANTWSAVINKQLRANGLMPTEEHKATSLRHSLSDRLLNAGCTEAIKDQLFGHVEDGTPYGEGIWLETAQEWLKRAAL